MDAATIAAAVNPLIAGAFELDPDAQARARALGGRVLAVEITGLDLVLYVEAGGDAIIVTGKPSHHAEARIAGPPASLLRLTTQSGTRALFSGAIRVTGDVTVARAYKRLFDTLEPDWEEALARVAGDITARQLGRLARGAHQWLRRGMAGRRADLQAWLSDETEALPARAQVERWYAEVDRLRHDSDRLAVRLARLERDARHDETGRS